MPLSHHENLVETAPGAFLTATPRTDMARNARSFIVYTLRVEPDNGHDEHAKSEILNKWWIFRADVHWQASERRELI